MIFLDDADDDDPASLRPQCPTTQSTHCVPDQMLLYFKIQVSFTSTVNMHKLCKCLTSKSRRTKGATTEEAFEALEEQCFLWELQFINFYMHKNLKSTLKER